MSAPNYPPLIPHDEARLQMALKKLMSRSTTRAYNPLEGPSNEVIPSNVQITASTVMAKALPDMPMRSSTASNAPASYITGGDTTYYDEDNTTGYTGSITDSNKNECDGTQYPYEDGVVESVRLELIVVQGTSYNADPNGDQYATGTEEAGDHAYYAVLPTEYETHSNNPKKYDTNSNPESLYMAGQAFYNTQGKLQCVPPTYGFDELDANGNSTIYGISGFTVSPSIYGATLIGDNGVRINATDTRFWYFDYYSGVLFQERVIQNKPKPKYIEVLLYIGDYLSEVLAESDSAPPAVPDWVWELAPSEAPLANSLAIATPSGVSAKLSMDENTAWANDADEVLGTTWLSNPTGIAPAIGVGDEFSPTATFQYSQTANQNSPTSDEYDRRLGVYFGDVTTTPTSIRIDINGGEPADPNNSYNYPTGSFGKADKGDIKLFINGVLKAHLTTLSTTSTAHNVTGVSGTGSSVISVGASTFAQHVNGATFDAYKYRSSSYVLVHPSDMKVGWNYAQVQHIIDETTTVYSNYITWIVDNNATSIDIVQSAPTINDGGSNNINYLSGVSYLSTCDITYNYDINNAYRNVYSSESDALSYDGTGFEITTPNTDTIEPPAPLPTPSNISDSISSGTLHGSFSLKSPSCSDSTTWTLGDTVSATVTVKHPDTSLSATEPMGTLSDTFLIYNSTNNGCDTNTIETFTTEDHRLKDHTHIGGDANTSTIYDLQSSVVTELNGGWDKTQDLDDATSGYLGLMCYKGTLRSPKNTNDAGTNITDGNFNATDFPSVINADYSGIDMTGTGTRWLYRAFKNDSDEDQAAWTVNITGGSFGGYTDIVPIDTTLDANKIAVEIKIPGITEWLDCTKQVTGTFTNGNGILYSSDASIGDSSHRIESTSPANFDCYILTLNVLSNDYIVMRVRALGSWAEDLSNITITWG